MRAWTLSKLHFFFYPAANVDCCSPLFLTCGSVPLSLSLTPSLFPPAAALRRGVENERYNALSLARPSPPFSPVYSMPYFPCCL